MIVYWTNIMAFVAYVALVVETVKLALTLYTSWRFSSLFLCYTFTALIHSTHLFFCIEYTHLGSSALQFYFSPFQLLHNWISINGQLLCSNKFWRCGRRCTSLPRFHFVTIFYINATQCYCLECSFNHSSAPCLALSVILVKKRFPGYVSCNALKSSLFLFKQWSIQVRRCCLKLLLFYHDYIGLLIRLYPDVLVNCLKVRYPL